MRRFLQKLPWAPLLLVAIFLGLAPFAPLPHLVEKLQLLARGELRRPLDIFDLLMHATPLLLVLLKLAFGRASGEPRA